MAERTQRVHTWVTYALIAANVVMFGFELASGVSGGSPTAKSMVEVGASAPVLTLHGEPWRLVTAMFLHFGILHIALNMVCLWQGRIVEQLYGRAGFLVLYLLAGLGGGIATLIRSGNIVSAGASGAVFGVYGAFAAFLVLRKQQIPEEAWKATARGIGMFIVINLIFGLSVPGISVSAHVGGLVFGFAIGAALLWKSPTRPRVARVALAAAAGLAVVVGAYLVLQSQSQLDAVARLSEDQDADVIAAFRTLAPVEAAAEARVVDVDKQRDAHTLDDSKAAYILEHDVLPPFREACGKLREAVPSPVMHDLHGQAVNYCRAREDAWASYAAALVERDPERRQGLMERRRFLEVEARNIAFELQRKATSRAPDAP